MTLLLLPFAGLVAGFIDSVAGGGGLITLPVFALAIGPGTDAIGTNKIVGAAAALLALVSYARAGHLNLRLGAAFCLWAGLGSFMGTLLSPLLPPSGFRWILAATCPVILWVASRKDIWLGREASSAEASPASPWLNPMLAASGFFSGVYDGAWGPGGGTFMFLGLALGARLPLLPAMATAKLANLCTAGTALASYASSGHVHWAAGLSMATGASVGAVLGAEQAKRSATWIVRPLLATVSCLLILKVLFG